MTMRLPTLSIRQILLLVTGSLTLVIALLCASSIYANAQRLSRIYVLRDASLMSDQLFDAAGKVALERDLALSMLSARDPDTIADLQPRLVESRVAVNVAVAETLAALDRYDFTDLAPVRYGIERRYANILQLRGPIDRAVTLPPRQRPRALAAQWTEEATGLMTDADGLWLGFIRHFTDIDAVATQHLRFKHFLRTITDYTGRERSVIGQIISENTDPTLQQTSDLLRGEGVLDLSWTTSRILAEQSGLYPEITSAYTDAESHYATMHDMLRAMFYVPGARHGASYLISPDLWFELSDQASESLTILRSESRTATRAYLDGLTSATEQRIAVQIGVFAFALLLCAYSFWVIIFRVISPINSIVDALLRATRGETVHVPAREREDEIGQLANVLHAFQSNVDEIKRTAAELDRSQNRLRSVVDYAMDGVVTVDRGGSIASFNPACEAMFGYSASEIVGRHLSILAPALYNEGDDDLSAYVATADAQRHGATAHEVTARRKDGTTFQIELTVSAFTLDDGVHYSGIVRDITLRKQTERTLLTYTHALERSNKELDDFAYIASHDLKEPLRGIHNHSRFLLEDNGEKLDEESAKRLHRLIYLSQRMERLVNDLLYFSRLGRQELAIQRTDLTAAIRDIENTLEHFLQENHARIVIAGDLPIVTCDKPRVAELFRNLITNAVKYNDKADRTVEIGFLDSVRGPAGAVMRNAFYVKDNGYGIDPEFHQEIFRIFKRLSPGHEEGTGVGLTFVKKIVERHGGQIWVESELGNGAIFYFTLEAPRHDAKIDTRAA